MKQLDQFLIRARAAARKVQASTPLGSALPVGIVVRLNDVGIPDSWVGSEGEPLDLHGWQRSLVLLLEWLGPVRLSFTGGTPSQSELLSRLVRFGNRLECPTHLTTAGGIEPGVIEELVDWGLSAVTIQVASLDEELHRSIVGTGLSQAAGTLECFSRVSQDRGRALELMVGIPVCSENIQSIGSIAGWARQCGAAGIFATILPGQQAPDGALEAIDSIGEANRTPEILRQRLEGRRVRDSPRLYVLSDGSLMPSNSGPILCRLPEADPALAWRTRRVETAGGEQESLDILELMPAKLVSHR
jgi:hypothetical protein